MTPSIVNTLALRTIDVGVESSSYRGPRTVRQTIGRPQASPANLRKAANGPQKIYLTTGDGVIATQTDFPMPAPGCSVHVRDKQAVRRLGHTLSEDVSRLSVDGHSDLLRSERRQFSSVFGGVECLLRMVHPLLDTLCHKQQWVVYIRRYRRALDHNAPTLISNMVCLHPAISPSILNFARGFARQFFRQARRFRTLRRLSVGISYKQLKAAIRGADAALFAPGLQPPLDVRHTDSIEGTAHCAGANSIALIDRTTAMPVSVL